MGGTLNLLHAMEDNDCRTIVFSSSATVYGEPESMPLIEKMNMDAQSCYGRTKEHIEDMLVDLAASDDRWNIALLRYFNPVGAHASVKSLLMPAMVLGALSLAYVLRLTRNSIAENRESDHVRTATAKGLPRRRVITVHVLRNSLIPVVTFLGTDLGALMGGAIVTEGIFNIPGVGGTIYQAIIRGEATTVVSFVTVLIVIYLICNVVVDLLYAALDPRIRYA